jgi:hypothetical protein
MTNEGTGRSDDVLDEQVSEPWILRTLSGPVTVTGYLQMSGGKGAVRVYRELRPRIGLHIDLLSPTGWKENSCVH